MAGQLIHPDLAHHIQITPLVDTHEHLNGEEKWVNEGPEDVLMDLLSTYVGTDLFSAVADPNDLDRARDPELGVRGRWDGISKAWQLIRHTGYGEGMARQAKEVYGIEEITGEALEAAQPILDKLRQPGERYRLLKEVANLDHIQTDNFCFPCLPDPSGPEFFFYDISWIQFCTGDPNFGMLESETGISVNNLATYRQAMEAIIEKYHGCAIALKSQHAYSRTLRWEARSDADVELLLQKKLGGKKLSADEGLCLGDWGWARGMELSAEYGLPFKIHTGFYAGANSMVVDRIKSGHLCSLALAHPETRLVLMHASYPYTDELVAMAKQFRNIYVDLCWAWSIDPYATADFVRKFIRAVPYNKLFAFGGDTHWPTGSLAYASQAREWLARSLSMEIRDDFLSLDQAKEIATHMMYQNQMDIFPVERSRKTAAEELKIAKAA